MSYIVVRDNKSNYQILLFNPNILMVYYEIVIVILMLYFLDSRCFYLQHLNHIRNKLLIEM